MKCPLCGHEINETAKYCSRCGKKVPRCPQCGMVITRNIRFCTNDGTPLPPEVIALFNNQSGLKHRRRKTAVLSSIAVAVGAVLVMCVVVILILDKNGRSGGRAIRQPFESYRSETSLSAEKFTETSQIFQTNGGEGNITELSENEEESSAAATSAAEAEPESESGAAESEIQERLLYFILHSDSEYFTEEDLAGFDVETCRLARNGIYARRGRMFQDEALQAYFEQYDWYVPTIEPDAFEESMLNDYEIANRNLVVEYEKYINDETNTESSVFGEMS